MIVGGGAPSQSAQIAAAQRQNLHTSMAK